MKTTLRTLLIALMAITFALPAAAKANKQKVLFYVYLHCDGCVQKVMSNIAYEKGVKDIVCSIEKQTVVVTYDANKTDIPTLQKAFAKIGKPATTTPPTDTNTGATIHHEDEHHHHGEANHQHEKNQHEKNRHGEHQHGHHTTQD